MTALLLLLLGGMAAAAPPPADVALYQQWCARCHGERGDGHGPASAALRLALQPPRDFTNGRFKLQSTPSGQAPSDADLAPVRHAVPAAVGPRAGDPAADTFTLGPSR